ncbi:MAG: hypothetical protein ABL930_07455 [Pseudobdellovibrio sp.]
MKYIIAMMLLLPTVSFSQEVQLGVIVGSTTGLSGKYDLGNDRAIDAALAYKFDNVNGLSLHADYLFNRARTFNVGEVSPINFYYGLGARLINIIDGSDNGKTRLGVRVPFGIYYTVNNPNLELFGELVPVLDLAPRTDVYVDVGLGFRIRF